MSTEKWTVKLGGHVQLGYINWGDSSPSIPNTFDYFEFRRLRLVADGTAVTRSTPWAGERTPPIAPVQYGPQSSTRNENIRARAYFDAGDKF